MMASYAHTEARGRVGEADPRKVEQCYNAKNGNNEEYNSPLCRWYPARMKPVVVKREDVMNQGCLCGM